MYLEKHRGRGSADQPVGVVERKSGARVYTTEASNERVSMGQPTLPWKSALVGFLEKKI